MKRKLKPHELETAQNIKVFGFYRSRAEGHVCLCGHVETFHWENRQGECAGKCGVADCECDAYDENPFAKIERYLPKPAPDDEDGLARALRQAENATVDDDASWDRAVHRAANPRRNRQRNRPSGQSNPALRDALEALGGNLDDLSS
jgi:hypothetical protein